MNLVELDVVMNEDEIQSLFTSFDIDGEGRELNTGKLQWQCVKELKFNLFISPLHRAWSCRFYRRSANSIHSRTVRDFTAH